jgi:citrate lyase subunit beta/citryl-CoA lyase
MDQYVTAGNKGEKVRSDCLVSLQIRQKGGIEVELHSKVDKMFGRQIRDLAHQVLSSLEVAHAHLKIEDSGALPFVIAARIEAAVKKQAGSGKSHILPLLEQNRYPSSRDRFRFSRLYLPGNTPSMMLNAGIHQPDGIILDLEDSVAPDKKPEARLLVRNALRQVDFYGAERMVRINQLPAGLDDLDEIIPAYVHLILIPKCESGEQVIMCEKRIKSIQKQEALDQPVYLMPIIESALGIEKAFEIASASSSVVALAIGLEDYTADLGVKRTMSGNESLYARTRLVNACKAAGIQPIDSVFSDVGDMEGLKQNVISSKSLGFEGMGCIHPRQVSVIRQGFCPDESEIVKAEKIIAAFKDAESRGLGVVALGSKMIDPPVVKRAMQTMELAISFGLRTG